MHTPMHARTHARTCACSQALTHVCMLTCACARTNTRACARTHARMCTHVHARERAHIRTHTHSYTHTKIHKYRSEHAHALICACATLATNAHYPYDACDTNILMMPPCCERNTHAHTGTGARSLTRAWHCWTYAHVAVLPKPLIRPT